MRPILLLLSLFCVTAIARPPNFVIIFADDLGYGDLGCYGHPSIRTPNLDRMAAEGMRFTDFYSASEVCTPSRTGLITGRYPIRSGMCHNQFRVLREKSTGHLPAGELTLPELLKDKGYATAMVGKWHMGNWANNPDGHPMNHGFDHYFGLPHSNDMNATPASPKRATARLDQDPSWWNAPLYRDRDLVEQPADQSTLTRRYADEAVKFIHDTKDKPFFLYFAHTFPHVPLFASSEHKGKSARGLYGDVVEELDASVGRVLEAVRGTDTLVFFSSDNGPWLIMDQAGGSAGLLREGKGSTWEGGMRVPGIAWWPGKIAPGSVQHELACTMDLLPTMVNLAGGALPADREYDGTDISPLLLGQGAVERKEAYLYYRGVDLYAARMGPWKAHFITRSGYGPDQPETHDPAWLYNVVEDPSERFEVSADHADILARIKASAQRVQATIKPVPTQLEAVVKPGAQPSAALPK